MDMVNTKHIKVLLCNPETQRRLHSFSSHMMSYGSSHPTQPFLAPEALALACPPAYEELDEVVIA